MNHGKHIIATTFADGFTYEEYVDFCEGNGINPGDDGSAEFYEWAQDEAAYNFEDDMDNILEYDGYEVPVIVTGVLGLWDGPHEIMPRKFESVWDAIQAIFGGGTDDIIVEWDDGEINVKAFHHDGVNRFVINKLTESAINKEDGFTPDDVERLPYLYDINE